MKKTIKRLALLISSAVIGMANADAQRMFERLDRGTVAVVSGTNIFVSWRLLATESQDIPFNIYRETDGTVVKLNDTPLTSGTNYTDNTADLTKDNTYFVKAIENDVEQEADGSYTVAANTSSTQAITIPINEGGTIHFVWVGDYNGDGKYDFLVDRCADDHQKLEAYLNDGTYLWTMDLGANSENKNNISPGASTIDVGMWDGATVYDIDMDGRAEVIIRIANGVTFGDGTTFTADDDNHQWIAVLNGNTGALKEKAEVPDDYVSVGPVACLMGIGYLDGKKPSVCCWLKNRNSDKSFNAIAAAYSYTNGTFQKDWQWNRTDENLADGHQIRIADVDYDGKDEFLNIGFCLNSNGTLRYGLDGVVHGDRYYVGAFSKKDNVMMGYGIQQENASGLLEYYYNASTGDILWTNGTTDGTTADVARGNVGDVSTKYDGFECWSFQGTFNQDGTKIKDTYPMYPVLRLWWDGDLMSESYNDGKIEKYNETTDGTERVLTTWKVADCTGSERGVPMFYGDILGDWREEVVMTSSDYSKLVILTTDIPSDNRLYCLAQNPCYRNCMTIKGYMQSHMLDYFLGYNMDTPELPNIDIIPLKSTEPEIALEATSEGNGIRLNWTLDNINSARVEVMRDTDSNPSGRGRVAYVYVGTDTYLDTNIEEGKTYYYWIKCTSDGQTVNSNMASSYIGTLTGVEQYATAINSLKVSASNTDDINLIIESAEGTNAAISIIDMTGNEIHSSDAVLTAGVNNLSLTSSRIANGVYAVKVKTNNTVMVERFIKN